MSIEIHGKFLLGRLLLSSSLITVLFSKLKKRHTQGKVPVVRNIMVVVRTVTTWRQNRNPAFGLEFLSSLEFGFCWALHLKSSVEIVVLIRDEGRLEMNSPEKTESKVSVLERSSWRDPLSEWGRSIISKGNFQKISSTEQAGKIRLTELIINDIYFLSYAHKFLISWKFDYICLVLTIMIALQWELVLFCAELKYYNPRIAIIWVISGKQVKGNHDWRWVQLVWFLLLGLWMRFGSQFPWKILVLPHSGRGSCQLLLYRTDTFVYMF